MTGGIELDYSKQVVIPDLVEPFDELGELTERLEGLSNQAKVGELSAADVAEATGHLLDDLALLQAAKRVRDWAALVRPVQEARDEAKQDTTDSLFNAGRLFTAIEDATKAIQSDYELQDILVNPVTASDRDVFIAAIGDVTRETLDLLARSDSLVLNEHVASEWLDSIDGMIVGGLKSLMAVDPQFRVLNGHLVIW